MTKRCELYLRLRAGALPDEATLEMLARDFAPAALLIEDGASPALQDFLDAAGRQNLPVLIGGDPALAKALEADGVHIEADPERLAEARSLLGTPGSIGASCPLTRHDAMSMGESGADYVAFGELIDGDAQDLDALLEIIGWWSELFEVPCVAWLNSGDTDDTARRLVEAGADYLAVPFDAAEGRWDLERLRQIAGIAANSVQKA